MRESSQILPITAEKFILKRWSGLLTDYKKDQILRKNEDRKKVGSGGISQNRDGQWKELCKELEEEVGKVWTERERRR